KRGIGDPKAAAARARSLTALQTRVRSESSGNGRAEGLRPPVALLDRVGDRTSEPISGTAPVGEVVVTEMPGRTLAGWRSVCRTAALAPRPRCKVTPISRAFANT